MLDTTAASIRTMQPTAIETPTGWMAISPRTAPLNIAVVGATADEATLRFRESAEAWARLHEAPDPAAPNELPR
jgi:hypothetical protein